MKQRTCPKCGHIENEYTYFCTECGEKTIESDIVVIKKENDKIIYSTDQNTTYEDKRSDIKNDSELGNTHMKTTTINNTTILISTGCFSIILIVIFFIVITKPGDNPTIKNQDNNSGNHLAALDSMDDSESREYSSDDPSYVASVDSLDTEIKEEVSDDSESQKSGIENKGSEETGVVDDSEIGIHTYELIVADISWSDAFSDCMDRGGNLVRINSSDEYAAIIQQINNENKQNIKFWIGASRGEDDKYYWIYGNGSIGDTVLNEDPLFSSYWLQGEPSFFDSATGTSENRLNMFYKQDINQWVWNDVPDDVLAVAGFYKGSLGYICEYE